ncbi:MAG: hypothetical protein R3E68_17175 [Burkholderiaceae bacterium]
MERAWAAVSPSVGRADSRQVRDVARYHVTSAQGESEIGRLNDAMAVVQEELAAISERLPDRRLKRRARCSMCTR